MISFDQLHHQRLKLDSSSIFQGNRILQQEVDNCWLHQYWKYGEVLLTPDELKYYADAFSAGGFTGPINWYRNWTHNWKSTKKVDQTVRVPSLFVGARDDAIISSKQIEAMKPHVPDLEVQIIDDCGHWTQQEKPQELNEILLDWLERKYPR